MSHGQPYPMNGFFEREKRGLLAFLTRRVGRQDASDLLQETYARVLRHGQLETIADPSAFLKQIAINLTRDFARRRKVEVKYLVFDGGAHDALSDEAPADRLIEERQRFEILAGAVASLPPRCREVFELRVRQNFSQEAIAKRLGISRKTVEQHLHIAMARCRTALK